MAFQPYIIEILSQVSYYISLNCRDWKVGVIGAIRGVIGTIRADIGRNSYNSYNYGAEFSSIGLVRSAIRWDGVDR